MRAVKALWCAIALALIVAPGAHADEWNKLTYLTFSGPVQLPGVTLPAGTYTFKLADSWSNRHIVQVFNKDQSKIFGTFLTVSDQKLDPSDKPVVMFQESPAGTPSAARAWFYPGDTIGDEFVYPKNQAVEIAKATHNPVMATDTEMNGESSAMKSAKVGHVDENGNMTEDNQDNRANSENNNENTSAAAAATDTQTPPATAGTSGTTGVYTAAPRESNHRTGVAENGDAMNRYGANGAATAGNRTTNPSMAPGGETVTSSTGTGTTAAANESNEQSRSHQPTTAATGTSGQATTAPSANANPQPKQSARNNGRRLPKTASPLGLFFALSVFSIGAGLTVRGARRHFVDAR